jgi:hypothetical protein
MHDHGPQPGHSGHYVALCDESDRLLGGIVVDERYFVPNYGYKIYEYRETEGVNELIIPE